MKEPVSEWHERNGISFFVYVIDVFYEEWFVEAWTYPCHKSKSFRCKDDALKWIEKNF